MNHHIAFLLALVAASTAQFLPDAKKAPDTQKALTCPMDTGAKCRVLGCHPWRNAECVEGSCVCKAGTSTCAYEGRCDTPEDKKRMEVEESAQAAFVHLQAAAGLQKTAADRIAAQKEAFDNSVKWHKAAVRMAEQEVAFKLDIQASEKEQREAEELMDKAKAEVAVATDATFAQGQTDRIKAEAAVKKAALDWGKSTLNVGHARTWKEDYVTSSAEEKEASTKCERDTQATCNALTCYDYRNAVCVSDVIVTVTDKVTVNRHRCLCRETDCAFNGMCVPADSFTPDEPEKRSAFVKAEFEKKSAADIAVLKASDSAQCEKDTKRACFMGTCLLYDQFNTASCVAGTCVCSAPDTCVIQGKCAHWTTSADLEGSDSLAVKMSSEPFAPLGLFPVGALLFTGLVGAFAFKMATRRQNQRYTEPLLEEQ